MGYCWGRNKTGGSKIMKNFLYFWIILIVVVFFGITLAQGIEKSIEKQDTMLCESAKYSGNDKWLKNCECYYKLNDIKCLQKQP